MKTIVLINTETCERQTKLVDGFLSSRNLRGAFFPICTPSEKPNAPSVKDVLTRLAPGDLLVIADIAILGNKFSVVMRELVYLFEHGIGLGIADTNTLIEVSGMKGKEYARMITFIADLFKGMNSRKTKTALIAAKEHGKKIGRPSGLSQLDGKEDEICEYLNKRVSKSAIARILGTSRANLSHFIAARKLTHQDFNTGGKSHGRG